MRYKLAIFDMDGTILDTLDDLCDAMNYALVRSDMPQRDREKIRCFLGNGIYRLAELSVPQGTSAEKIEEVIGCFHEYYKDHCAIKTKPYDEICEVIATLRRYGVKTAVVSNKVDYAVKSLCRDYFDGLFDYSVGDKAGQRRKPYPDSVNAVLNYFGVPREQAVYIGDSEVDFETAKNAQVDDIIVSWGFRTEEYLKSIGVKRVVHRPNEILEIIIQEK